MKRLCAMVVVLLPLAVIAVHAGTNSTVDLGPSAQYWSGSSPMVGSGQIQPVSETNRAGNGPLLLAKDLDLRDVDWDKVKAGKNGKNGNGNGKNGNGDKEDGEEEEDGDKKDAKDEKEEEGGGGWDRQWDAPKLG